MMTAAQTQVIRGMIGRIKLQTSARGLVLAHHRVLPAKAEMQTDDRALESDTTATVLVRGLQPIGASVRVRPKEQSRWIIVAARGTQTISAVTTIDRRLDLLLTNDDHDLFLGRVIATSQDRLPVYNRRGISLMLVCSSCLSE